MDEAVRRIGAPAQVVAGHVPQPHLRPVVRGRDIDQGNVAVDHAAVQPVGMLGEDFTGAENPGHHREMAAAQAIGPL